MIGILNLNFISCIAQTGSKLKENVEFIIKCYNVIRMI